MEQVELTPDKWEEMTVSELIDQRTILFNRYDYLVSVDASYADKIQEGLNKIEKIITDKLNVFSAF